MRASVCFFSACYLRTSEPLVVIGVCLFGNKDKPSLHPMYNIAYENPLLSEYRLYSAKHWAWMDEGETILALSSLLYRASCVARPAPTGTRP